ncbi:MAG: ABC transporter permease, partial [Ktedonobacterales bacterium]
MATPSTTPTTTESALSLPSHQTPPERGRATTATRAFLAILQRDIVVTGREFISFLIQVLLQPLFFLFIFGKVLPKIGFASANFGAVLLPGIVSLTVIVTALQGVTLPLVLDLGFAREIDDRLLAPLPVPLVAIEKIIFAALRGLV